MHAVKHINLQWGFWPRKCELFHAEQRQSSGEDNDREHAMIPHT